ncbi:MAG: preprotein translocase subunit SecE [Candidatus Dojkabacteria bacterium]
MKIIRNIITELKQTEWPTISQLARLTIYTVVLCGIIALLILGIDMVFFWLRDLWLGGDKEVVSNLILNF